MPGSVRIYSFAISLVVLLTACGGNVFNLAVGDCFDDWEGSLSNVTQEVSDVPIVDCADPHDNEVYSVSEMPSGPFPGDQAIEDWTIARCSETFDPYVGIAYEESVLDFGAFFPTQDTWDRGDTEVMCFLWHINFEKLTESMQGSGI